MARGTSSADCRRWHGRAYVPRPGPGRGDGGSRLAGQTVHRCARRALCRRLPASRWMWNRCPPPPLRVVGSLAKAMVPLRIAGGCCSAPLFAMLRDRPAVVVGFGGYPSIPALSAATLLRRPRMIHEQNGVLGPGERQISPVASMPWPAAPGPPPCRKGLSGIHTGNPVRGAVLGTRRCRLYPAGRLPDEPCGHRRQPRRAHPVGCGARGHRQPARGPAPPSARRPSGPRRRCRPRDPRLCRSRH